ncbi:hypothetical protein [Leptolyngbya sp. NIES-2104]|uniref:hypothetical protein n=1 Tax=Leptolyngbya sp. NIES-2104 TaxID=1552121 RepID=UPI0012E3C532|nr:hypothetical protein [Leptolyngbya sp. NIES-2104]
MTSSLKRAPERQSFGDVLLKDRLTNVIDRINAHIPPEIRATAQRELQNICELSLTRQ